MEYRKIKSSWCIRVYWWRFWDPKPSGSWSRPVDARWHFFILPALVSAGRWLAWVFWLSALCFCLFLSSFHGEICSFLFYSSRFPVSSPRSFPWICRLSRFSLGWIAGFTRSSSRLCAGEIRECVIFWGTISWSYRHCTSRIRSRWPPLIVSAPITAWILFPGSRFCLTFCISSAGPATRTILRESGSF